MAYVDFARDSMLADAGDARRDAPAPAPEATGLSALEWSVVALAQHDRISSLDSPSRLSIALGAVFGARRHSPNLADPRLEALRRIAVLTWHGGADVPVGEQTAFLRAGFSTAQYRTLRTSIMAARSRLEAWA